MAIVSIGVFSLPIISTNTTTMPIVAIPVSICDLIVNKGAIFIFTKLVDKFRLQC